MPLYEKVPYYPPIEIFLYPFYPPLLCPLKVFSTILTNSLGKVSIKSFKIIFSSSSKKLLHLSIYSIERERPRGIKNTGTLAFLLSLSLLYIQKPTLKGSSRFRLLASG